MNALENQNTKLISCRKCPRLVDWRERIAVEKRRAYYDWYYWGKPIPGFGDDHAKVMVVGLAPGAHGSNRTGRMFTGDASGDFLFPALYRAGFANKQESHYREDGLVLRDLFITAVCRCVPPANKPTLQEMITCQPYLVWEIEYIQPKIVVALGRIAFERILNIWRINIDTSINHRFVHGAVYNIPSTSWLVCSYHPSRQNTQTGRLTIATFDQIWHTVVKLLQKRSI